LKAIGAVILLALGVLPPGGPAFAQARDKAPNPDRPLLATFCDAAHIKGSACRRAKGYRSGKRCDVKLQPEDTAENCSPTAARFSSSTMRATAKPTPRILSARWSRHLRTGDGHGPVIVVRGPEAKCRNRRLELSSRRPRQNTFRNILSESLNPFAD
jgi:hypothetical protein